MIIDYLSFTTELVDLGFFQPDAILRPRCREEGAQGGEGQIHRCTVCWIWDPPRSLLEKLTNSD